MKKVIMLAAVVAALASCQSKANKAAEAQADSLALAMTPITELTEVYEGTLPAADGPGIDYVLTLNAATDGVDTTYTLRSEERRVGKECLRLCRSRWSPYH